jgi:hypothetical protein
MRLFKKLSKLHGPFRAKQIDEKRFQKANPGLVTRLGVLSSFNHHCSSYSGTRRSVDIKIVLLVIFSKNNYGSQENHI